MPARLAAPQSCITSASPAITPTCFCANYDAGIKLLVQYRVPTAIKGGTSKRLGVLKRRCDSSEVIPVFSRSFRTIWPATALSLLLFVSIAGQNLPADPAAKLLPNKLGDFSAAGTINLQKDPSFDRSEHSGVTSAAGRSYVSK